MLSAHLSPSEPAYVQAMTAITERLLSDGDNAVEAATRAQAILARLLQQQAILLAALDCFLVLGLLAMIGPLLAVGIKAFDQTGGRGGSH